jgi:osmotically-inducible protein OsmY
MKTDMQLHNDVLAELISDPCVTEKEIGVAVKGGVVTLTGSVPSFGAKWVAERAVERVAGVNAVANDLTVKIPGALTHSDTEIAHQVVKALTWDIQVPHDTIKASVVYGWVTLEGEVEWQFERNAATKAICNLAGVRGVTNNITLSSKHRLAHELTCGIKEALERRADRTADRIVVETKGSVVTLTGTVPSLGDRRAAAGVAWSAPGVTEVRDALTVRE